MQLEAICLMDGDPPAADMALCDITDFEDDDPTMDSTDETGIATAEGHVDTALAVGAFNIDMVAHGVQAPTLAAVLAEIENSRRVALIPIDAALGSTNFLKNLANRYRDKLNRDIDRWTALLTTETDPEERRNLLDRREADLSVVAYTRGKIAAMDTAIAWLTKIRKDVNDTYDITKTRIKALYNQPEEGQAAVVTAYYTDDLDVVESPDV